MRNTYRQILLGALAVFILFGALQAQAQQVQRINVVSADSIADIKNPKSKEISREVAMPQNGEIYVQNNYRSLQVKTWDQQKVKLTSTFFYSDQEPQVTDEELMEQSNISLKVIGSSVKIKAGIGSNNYSSFSHTPYEVYNSAVASQRLTQLRLFSNKKNNSKSDLIIYIPIGVKIDIEHKYGYVQLANGITEASIDISNGSLEAEDINKLILRSKYASTSLGNVKNAEVELTNGRLTAKNMDDLDIDSKNSTIELAMVKTLNLRSTSDEYELEEVGELRGRKNYGNLRITHLKGLLELEGQNADIKIKNVAANVSHIKIDDKYADIRIPLRSIKAYSINFSGAYSTVYGDFEKKAVEEKATTANSDTKTDTKEKAASGYATSSTKNQQTTITLALLSPLGGNDTPSKFTAAVGDGKGIKIDMKCQNCTVDFK